MPRVCVDDTYFNVLPDGRLTLDLSNIGFATSVIFNAPGASNFDKSAFPATAKVHVRMTGGGGGGAGVTANNGECAVAGGGGGGAYSEAWLTMSMLNPIETVIVGSGGAGGVGSNNGAAGGASSFGAWLTAPGGSGSLSTMGTGTTPATVVGANGASPGAGAAPMPILQGGSAGLPGIRINNLAATSGKGGDGGWFSVGAAGRSNNGPGAAANVNSGSGGAGANATGIGAASSQNGGAGGSGYVRLDIYF